MGSKDDLEKIIRKNNIEEIVISFRENDVERKKEVRNICRNMAAEVKITQMRLVIS